tara:strand:+ start:623 stop:1024 length:402 start_codon:yes stop_codon:yes gene_type:complete
MNPGGGSRDDGVVEGLINSSKSILMYSMLNKKKTNPVYKMGDMVWLRYFPEDCQHIEAYKETEEDWTGPFLVIEVIHESRLLLDEELHNKLDIPSILFEPTNPQWYCTLLTDVGALETPIREDYLEIFSKVGK